MVAPVANSEHAGYLRPDSSPAPLEGEALLDLIHDVIAGITGLDDKLVRPRWQSEPANPPDAGTAWCSVGVAKGDKDAFAAVVHRDTTDGGADDLQRHEMLNLLCSFYDLGDAGLADFYCDRLADGLQIEQNRAALKANNIDLVEAMQSNTVPTLVKSRWQYRVDLPVVLRRQILRTYQVRNLASARVQLKAEDQTPRLVVDETITVTQ